MELVAIIWLYSNLLKADHPVLPRKVSAVSFHSWSAHESEASLFPGDGIVCLHFLHSLGLASVAWIGRSCSSHFDLTAWVYHLCTDQCGLFPIWLE